MADPKVIVAGPNDIAMIAELYNQVFSPAQDEDFFLRRFQARHNVNMFVAVIEEKPAGFIAGFEVMPTTYFCWLCGVLPSFRRMGLATQLIQSQQIWSKEREYQIIRFECQNTHRPMLHVAIREGYDLVGIRWDTASSNNVVIFEKDLGWSTDD